MPAEGQPTSAEGEKAQEPEESKKNKLLYDKERLQRDNQLVRALDLLKALQIYSNRPTAAR